jgi:hypothetical protein
MLRSAARFLCVRWWPRTARLPTQLTSIRPSFQAARVLLLCDGCHG